MRLNEEEQYLLARVKRNGYVTTDRRDEYDVVADAYQQWCREAKQSLLAIALGDATSRVIYSLLEAEPQFPPAVEQLFRRHLPPFCLSTAGIVIVDDYWIAERVVNEQLPLLVKWLEETVAALFTTFPECLPGYADLIPKPVDSLRT